MFTRWETGLILMLVTEIVFLFFVNKYIIDFISVGRKDTKYSSLLVHPVYCCVVIIVHVNTYMHRDRQKDR